jgi:hypothetical protein
MAFAFATGACIDLAGHSCSGVGYTCDHTTITLQSPNDAWTTGTYTLNLSVDGTPGQCTVQIPDPPPANGVQGNCGLGSNLTLTLVTVDSCPPVVCDNNLCQGMSCTAVPGHFQMNVVISSGTGSDASPRVAAQVALDLSVNGRALVSEAISPKSTTTEPNGAGCGTCTNASATLSVAGG